MIYASLIYRDYNKNSLFNAGVGENNGQFYLPYVLLKESFAAHGVELNTPDLNAGKTVAFELHINCRRQDPDSRAYVYLYENPLIRPLNRNLKALSRYAKWFTWDEKLMKEPRAVRLFYPNKIESGEKPRPEARPLFLALVASNKALNFVDPRSQHQERIRIIDWYEKNESNDFHLYGIGWDCAAALSGQWGRICNQIKKLLARFSQPQSPFKTWRGPIKDKIELLKQARFCIAHENSRDLPGYITEKIFDCFRAGCVPVYVGPKEIHDFIPEECFIDGRKFSNPAEMDAFLRSIDDETYREYQKSIKDFLLSERAKPFSQEYFVDTIVQTILADLAANKP